MDTFYTGWIDSVALATIATNQHSILLLNAQYVPDPDTHTARANIPTAAIIAEANLQNKSVTQGNVDFDDVTFPGVAASSNLVTSLVVIDNTTDQLLCIHQTVTGLSIAPNGNDITLTLDTCGYFGL